MTEQEPKSECCGADVIRRWRTRYIFGVLDETFYHVCSKCYKPCSIAKLPKVSKVKEERGEDEG